MSAGFKSTEFWHAVVAQVAGLVLLGYALVHSDDTLCGYAVGLLGVSTFAYSHSRGKAKAPRPYLPPQGRL